MSGLEEQNLEQIKSKVDDLSTKFEKLYDAIMGTEFNENAGYKLRIEKLENKVETLEKLIFKWKWILIGAIAFGGYGGLTFLQQLIQTISKIK